jgi:hypothetical protein
MQSAARDAALSARAQQEQRQLAEPEPVLLAAQQLADAVALLQASARLVASAEQEVQTTDAPASAELSILELAAVQPPSAVLQPEFELPAVQLA